MINALYESNARSVYLIDSLKLIHKVMLDTAQVFFYFRLFNAPWVCIWFNLNRKRKAKVLSLTFVLVVRFGWIVSICRIRLRRNDVPSISFDVDFQVLFCIVKWWRLRECFLLWRLLKYIFLFTFICPFDHRQSDFIDILLLTLCDVHLFKSESLDKWLKTSVSIFSLSGLNEWIIKLKEFSNRLFSIILAFNLSSSSPETTLTLYSTTWNALIDLKLIVIDLGRLFAFYIFILFLRLRFSHLHCSWQIDYFRTLWTHDFYLSIFRKYIRFDLWCFLLKLASI
jgi:hypothetical protein